MVGQTTGRRSTHQTPFVRDQRRTVRCIARGAPRNQPRYRGADAQPNPAQVLQRDEGSSGNVPGTVPTMLQPDAGPAGGRREGDSTDSGANATFT